jgi:N-acetyl-gamma-glutamyl-phosphate reductase
LIKTAIVGASGYSGAELLRLLHTRDDIELTHLVAASSAGKRVADVYPWFTGKVTAAFQPLDHEALSGADVVFCALPSGEAMHIVPSLRGSVGRIIDLGGDFRLQSTSAYKEFYQHDHTAPELLGESVYGLPEWQFDRIRAAKLLANPGCYPTSAILGLLPALKLGLVEPTGIVINSLSGVSGAGRSASVDMSFTEVNENIRAYKIGRHQHIPEIESVLSLASGKPVSCSFVPHLVPITRGIYTTIHANLTAGISRADAHAVYESFYRDAPFVRVRQEVPQIAGVVRTNFCDVCVMVEPRTNQLIITSVIDNLVKGAAGQAVQNMNIMFDLPQERGLL